MRISSATVSPLFALILSTIFLSVLAADDSKVNPYVGQWRLLAVVVDGKEVPISQSTINTVAEDGWSVSVDGKQYSKGTSKRYPEFPDQSDVIYKEGALAGTTTKQITKIEGDVMIACAGEKRPTEFKSRPGSGQSLSVWIRIK